MTLRGGGRHESAISTSDGIAADSTAMLPRGKETTCESGLGRKGVLMSVINTQPRMLVLGALVTALMASAAPICAFAADSTDVPKHVPVDRPGKAPARVVSPAAAAQGVVRIYRDSVAWFGEDRDTNTWLSLGKTLGTDLFIHP